MPISHEMPNNLEAEQAILCCLMTDNELQPELLSVLSEDDFYPEAHKLIFLAMRDLFARGSGVDLITVNGELDRSGKLDSVGGISYLSDIEIFLPAHAHYNDYLDIVKDFSYRRRVIRAANKIIEKGLSADGDESVAFAEKEIYDISMSRDTSTLTLLSESFQGVLEKFQAVSLDPNAFSGLKTGFKELDRYTNGLKKGNLIILAARPSLGKTTLAMNIVENIALSNSNKVCAVFALEMTKEELAERMLSSVSDVDNKAAIEGRLDESGWQKLWAADKRLTAAKIYVDDTPMTTPAEILSKCRRLKGRVGLDLIVIDHIQLMEASRSHRRGEVNRQQEITEISRNLKMIAKELDIPVLALSQLSRLVTGRKGQRPMLSDLRESGAIEQDADIVMFIHRPDKVAEGKELIKGEILENVAEILIEKNRSGEVGSFELLFEGAKTRFVDLPAGYKDRQTSYKGNGASGAQKTNTPDIAKDLQNAPFDTGYPSAPYDEEFVPPVADGYGEINDSDTGPQEENIPDASESF